MLDENSTLYYKDHSVISVVLPYLVGALVGAGIALLMAPKSGYETRGLLLSKGNEIKDKAVDTVDDTRTRASRAIGDLASQTKENISSIRNRGQEAVDEGVSRVGDKMASVRHAISSH